MSNSDPLLQWRSQFPIAETSNYLINNSLGAMPKSARASVQEYLDTWETRGVRAWAEGWWQLKDEVANLMADVIGVDHDTVSMHQNVAMASQSIVSCFDFKGPRNRIVYTDLNFPSVMYLYEAQAAFGAEIVRVPSDDGGISIDLQRLLDAIDERTLLVPISHALFRSSYLQDAKAIVAKAREVGAFVILDVFQSIGVMPLQLKEWGVHAAVGGALKFLCGGPGNCFLYVDPEERKKLKPAFTGWSAHQDPFAFSAEGQVYREDGGRFLNGTPNVPALYAGREGIRIVRDAGLPAIRKKNQHQTSLIVAQAQKHGMELRSPLDPESRSGHVSIQVPHGYEVCQVLLEEDIVVDYRPGAGIRLSPHFFTKDQECLAAVDRMAEILETGAYKKFVGEEKLPG